MIIVLGSSIAIRILAIVWSVILIRRIKDWRIGFLTVMFILMALRQSLTLWHTPPSALVDFTLATSELPGLIVSIMAFLAIFFLEKILTAPKKAKKDLEESEKRFYQLTENLEEIFWLSSIDGEQIFYVSPAYENIFCRSLSDFEQNPKVWMDYILPEDRTTVQESFTESNLVRGNFNVEYRIQRPDGSIRWIKAKGVPVKNELGETYRIAGIATDITQEKIFEICLQKSQTLFQTLAKVSPVGIFHTDEKGFCTFVNDRWCEISGLTFREAQDIGWASALHPEDRDRVFAEWGNFIREGKTFQMEYRFLNASGKLSWVFGQAEAERDLGNNVIGYVGTITDITQLKTTEMALKSSQAELEQRVAERTADLAESEERFRKMFEEGGIGMVMANPAFYFTKTNQAFCRMMGYTEAELKSKTFLDITHPDDIGKNIELIQKLIKQEIPSFQMEKRCVRKDGGIIWININVFIIQVQSEESSYSFIGLMENITQRKEAEVKIRKAQEQAEKASRAKSEFLSHMSHELRTPLNAILGFAQLLELDRKHTLDPRQKESIQQIRIAGNHLLELINEVLDLTRIETGSLKVFNENTDVSRLLKKLLPGVEPMAEKNNVQIKNQISHSPLYVFADSTRLKQALLNLIANAIKYNRKNGEVFITGEMTDDNRVKIHIRDTGPGIEPEYLEAIFKPFERLGAEQSGIEGTGIGLSITQKMVELMNGSVLFKSEVGKGSCFTIELPGGTFADTVPPEPSSENNRLPDPANERHDNKTILYIEDNISSLNLVKRYIEECSSFRILASQNPMDGLELARRDQPALILMDINLPEMDGIQAFKELQKCEETKSIPVIAVSANAMDHDIKLALDAGFRAYVTKPVELPQLMDTIHQTLNLSTK